MYILSIASMTMLALHYELSIMDELIFIGPRLRLMGLGHFFTSVLIRDLAEVKDSEV